MTEGTHEAALDGPRADVVAFGAVLLVLAVVFAAVLRGGSGDTSESTVAAGLPKLAVGSLAPSEAASAPSRMLAPVTFELSGPLPALDSKATAYRMGVAGASADAVAELRDALGLQGVVRGEENAWVVDDGELSLRVERVAGLPWSLFAGIEAPLCGPAEAGAGTEAYAPSPDCLVAPEDTVVNDPNAPSPAEARTVTEPTRPKDLPGQAEALAAGKKVLTELGVDLTDAKVDAFDGFTSWDVVAETAIDGVPVTGLTWSIGIGSKGRVVAGNGWLAAPVELGAYPLIGVEEGFKRLTAAGGEGRTVETLVAEGEPCPEVSPDCHGGAPAPFVQKVTGAKLGVLFVPAVEQGHDAYLVPVFLFTLGTGGETPIVAVEDGHITATASPHTEL